MYLYLKVSKCWHVDTRTNKRWIIEIKHKKYAKHMQCTNFVLLWHKLWSLRSMLKVTEISVVFLSDVAHMICFIPYGRSFLNNFQFCSYNQQIWIQLSANFTKVLKNTIGTEQRQSPTSPSHSTRFILNGCLNQVHIISITFQNSLWFP